MLFKQSGRRVLCAAMLIATAWRVAAQVPEGQFWRVFWYPEEAKPGLRIRVNSRGAAVTPATIQDPDPRESGVIEIPVAEDIRSIQRAELYLEVDGGLPGTAGKRFVLNGRSQYFLPEVGTFGRNFTHIYPAVNLQTTDLINGVNVFQFACDRGQNVIGYYYIDNAALRLELSRRHPMVRRTGLMGFNALIRAEIDPSDSEKVRLQLASSDEDVIASVDYQAFYFGYDENGDTATYGWHGMTRGRKPVGFIGTSATYPYSVEWDTAMLPPQHEMAVRAVVHFKFGPGIEYITPAIGGLSALKPRGTRVMIYPSRNLPAPFTTSDSQRRSAVIEVDVDPPSIQKADLHLIARKAGGVGGRVEINGNSVILEAESPGGVGYHTIRINPGWLRKGANKVEVFSSNDGDPIEVLLPGPALIIRSR